MSVDNIPSEQLMQYNELDFPWPLIKIIQRPITSLTITLKSIISLLFSFTFQLVVMGTASIVCIVFGTIYLRGDGDRRMLCRAFIIQGTCGLFVVLVHLCAIIFNWTPSKLTHKPVTHGQLIWTLMAFTHVVTIFCVVWFFVSHIWFARQFRIKYDDYRYWHSSYNHNYYNNGYYNNGYYNVDYFRYDYDRELRKFTIAMFVVHYVVGGFLILGGLWNFIRVLRHSKANTQDHLTVEEPINHEKMAGVSVINVQYL